MFNVFHLFHQLNLYFLNNFSVLSILSKAKVELSEQKKPKGRWRHNGTIGGLKSNMKSVFPAVDFPQLMSSQPKWLLI